MSSPVESTQRHSSYAVVFLGFAMGLVVAGIEIRTFSVAGSVAMLWTGVSFGQVAMAYASGRPSWLGKGADGSRPFVLRASMLPYQWLGHVVLFASSRFGSEPVSKIEDGLWVARRVDARQWPREVTHVIDLAAEFERVRGTAARPEYLGIPMLDGLATDLEHVATRIRELGTEARVLIHCAQGHGRSGLVAAVLLNVRHGARDVNEVIAQLRTARPGIRLSARQEGALRRWVSTRRSGSLRR